MVIVYTSAASCRPKDSDKHGLGGHQVLTHVTKGEFEMRVHPPKNDRFCPSNEMQAGANGQLKQVLMMFGTEPAAHTPANVNYEMLMEVLAYEASILNSDNTRMRVSSKLSFNEEHHNLNLKHVAFT